MYQMLNVECVVSDSAKDLYLDAQGVPNSNWPIQATVHSAGLDLRLSEDLELHPGESKLVSTGLSIWIKQPGVVGLVMPRSSTGGKLGVVLGNGTGVIDADYQGELKLVLTNRNPVMLVAPPKHDSQDRLETNAATTQDETGVPKYWYSPLGEINADHGYRRFQRGERVAQILFMPVFPVCLYPVEQFSADSLRGTGGFGSTGTN